MLITSLFVRSAFLLKDTAMVDNTITLSKKARTDKQWGNQHWWTTQ
jgi:hypothetical protein